MFVFEERGKQGKNLSEQGREPTRNSTLASTPVFEGGECSYHYAILAHTPSLHPPQMNNCSCFTKCSLQKGYFAKVVGYTTEKRWLTFHSKRRTGQAINSNSRGVPEASALAMLLRKIPMNHSREYWYMGSMLA